MPVTIRQHDVEQDQIVTGDSQMILRLRQACRQVHGMTVQRQPVANGGCRFSVLSSTRNHQKKAHVPIASFVRDRFVLGCHCIIQSRN